MYPITPHLAEEMWRRSSRSELLAKQPWPRIGLSRTRPAWVVSKR